MIKILAVLITYSSFLYSQSPFYQTFTEENISGESKFGKSVANAGDINNDGYDDVIVGAPYDGKAYIFFGSAEPDNIPDVILGEDEDKFYFGHSVSTAGDVNNDGFSDVIVGTKGNEKAYIFLGSDNMDNSPDVILSGNEDSFYFGYSVSTAGDLNNDGYSDVLVSSQENSGAVYVFNGSDEMDNLYDHILLGEGRESRFGNSISTAGDINNDGYDDILVGAIGDNLVSIYLGNETMGNVADIKISSRGFAVSTAGDINNDGFDDFMISSLGKVLLFYGATSLNKIADKTIIGDPAEHSFGYSISNANDLNNDGFDDFIIGSPARYNSNIAKVYIYYGGDEIDDSASIVIDGNYHDSFGTSVSSAGDMNADGYNEVIIGAQSFYDDKGRADIHLGSIEMDEVVDISLFDEGSENFLGYTLSNAGDVNSDGFDDIIIGAKGFDSFKGRAYLYFGSNNFDNNADIVFTGERNQDYFSSTVSSAGDVNNDGFDDILICAVNFYKGKAYLYFGSNSMDNIADVVFNGIDVSGRFASSADGIGDINGDGYDDFVIAELGKERAHIYLGNNEINSTPYLILTGEDNEEDFGRLVTGCGDVNGDGYDDFIITSRNKAHLYLGANLFNGNTFISLKNNNNQEIGGVSFSSGGDINNDGFNDILARGSESSVLVYFGNINMDGIPDYTITTRELYSSFGFNLSVSGDLNNDGFDDILIGALGYNYGAGSVNIYYGGSALDSITDLLLTGEKEEAKFGSSISTSGDVNNDGFDDILIGAPEYESNGRAYNFFGGEIIKVVEPTQISPPNKASNISKSTNLVWNRSIGAEYYQLEIATDREFEQKKVTEIILSPDTLYLFDKFDGLETYYWHIRKYNDQIISKWSETMEFTTLLGSTPSKLILEQNYPNPFRQITTIEYGLPEHSYVNIEVFNILGQKVGTIFNNPSDNGYNKLEWNASNLSSGVYIIRIQATGISSEETSYAVRKVVLIK